ncbi:dTMP kinase [Streptomyces sp. R302]|uniref:dTMP kinase n=1 Tax=unclassified Streptomyces TaxID=2593676 RepID=UPI00145D29B7|nr:dTMP kinase [Streptomyces sp. R301]NML83814.1 dTMP kinase [Streptomyces sp. R302]
MSGRFITIDGPGGVGKSTTHQLLADALALAGHHVHTAAQPSHSTFGKTIRALGGAGTLRGRALALAVAADRHHQLDSEIQPALAAGRTVVLDRYLPSTLVLQRKDGVDTDFLLAINEGIPAPDLAVVLLAQADTIHNRLSGRGTRHRFELTPADTQRELTLYEEAIPLVEQLGYPVLRLDTTDLTPREAAAQIFLHLQQMPATVSPTVPQPR